MAAVVAWATPPNPNPPPPVPTMAAPKDSPPDGVAVGVAVGLALGVLPPKPKVAFGVLSVLPVACGVPNENPDVAGADVVAAAAPENRRFDL